MTVKPCLTAEQVDASVKPIIEEYLEHGNSTEVEVSSQRTIVFSYNLFNVLHLY